MVKYKLHPHNLGHMRPRRLIQNGFGIADDMCVTPNLSQLWQQIVLPEKISLGFDMLDSSRFDPAPDQTIYAKLA